MKKLKYHLIWLLLTAAMVSACTKTVEVPVVKEVVREVKVPVHAACVVNRPDPPVALRDEISREVWQSLTTDQRANLVSAKGLERTVYGSRLEVATMACP